MKKWTFSALLSRAHRVFLLLLAIVFLLGRSDSIQAQAPANDGTRVAKLIDQLSASNFKLRDAASAELAEMGTASREQLVAALKHKDPEVRLRASDLLARIDVELLWGSPKLAFKCDNLPIEKALDQLAEKTGNHVLAGERYGSFEEASLTLDLPQASFWQALDTLCSQTGNHVRPHYNPRQPGLVVVSGKPGSQPLAYAGPLRAQLASARRIFHEDLDYETGKSELTHTFLFNLQVIWEDRFRLVAYRSQPEIVSALTDTGMELLPQDKETPTWNVASPGIRQLSASLRLSPPPRAAKTLSKLVLQWEMIAVGSMRSMQIAPALAEARMRSEDAELLVEKIEERPGGRYLFTVLVSRDLITPEPADALLHENELELTDAAGRPFHHQGETNSLADRGVRMVVTFQAPEADAKPHALKLNYPSIRSQRQATIEFKNVPLPVAGPE